MKISPQHIYIPRSAASHSLSQAKSETAQNKPDEFSRAEQQELEHWQGRFSQDLGTLTTPPVGGVSGEMDAARGYVLDMVDRLAGKEITKSGIELRVEVFSGNTPQATLDDDMWRETLWDSKYQDTWPIRQWMEVPDGQKRPIYRMAVNAGMLNALETEDELAFVLAHQTERLLDHVKLDPDNTEKLDPATRSFVDSREMQAAADKAAVERISKAGFNPRAALKALTTLYSLNPIDYPENDLKRALLAAAHDHEAEGMRVGAVQAEVENYVRRGDPTASQEMKPLPAHLKLDVRPQYDKPVDDIEAHKANYQSLAEKLATDETPGWMFRDGFAPREHFLIQQNGGDRLDKEVALLSAAQHLDQLEGKTSQQKVDGLLRLMLSLPHSTLTDEAFSNESLKQLHGILAKHGSDWKPETFFNSLKSGRRSLHFTFVNNLVYDRNFQEMTGGALPGLAEAVPMAWLTRSDDEPQPNYLPSLVRKNHQDDRETWPLAQGIDKAMLDYLSTLDPTSMVNETGRTGLSKASEYANELFGLKEPKADFKARLREAGSLLADKAGESRENKARIRLRLPLSEPTKVSKFLEAFGETESWKEFSPEFERDLRVLLKDLATISVQQPGFVSADGEVPAFAPELERLFVENIKDAATSEEQAIGLTNLARHIVPSRRVRAHSPRREWLGEAARLLAKDGMNDVLKQISEPDQSQHSGTISQALRTAYSLAAEDLPDTSTPSLRALNERVQAEEFVPRREDYRSDGEYRAAQRRYSSAQSELRKTLRPIVPIESRGVLGKLALLGFDSELSEKLVSGMGQDSFERLLRGAEQAQERHQITTALYNDEDKIDVGADVGGFLMDGFLAVQKEVKSLDAWYDLATRSIDFSKGGLEARVGTKKKLGDNFVQRLETLEKKELREWLGKEKSLELLSAEQSSSLLLKCLGEDCAPGVDPKVLSQRVSDLEKQYKLIDEYPVAYVELRDKVAEKAQLQPSTVDTVFPEVVKGVTETSQVYREHARSLSGLVALARERSPEEQLDTIEYMMGRLEDMPAYLEEASEDQNFAPLRQSLETTRQDLLEADSQTRVMIANSFLAGPSGVLRTEQGKEAVIHHFLKNLKPENKELAEKIARGVLYSHGEADTLAVAFILGQLPEEPKEGQDPGKSGQLSEATILNRLFDAYGVPGIKMKQYLAFTSEFKDFKDAFEDAQDASMPLNYYQVLKLVQNRFGDEWPKDLKIDRVLGSGSVNVAIRYRNEESGKREVVSLGREDIEESTKYDFDRFNKLIGYMTQTPEDKEEFGYILGLLGLINDSVALEFQKEQAMGVQQAAFRTYRHEINDWEVRSIDAYRVENLGLFMEEAKGKTARKTYQNNEELYKEAMDAMAAAEFGVLRGVDSSANWRPKPLFANPDFHDGQVMIDEESKTVTILDFGQAVPISNEDRVGGLDLMTIIGKVDSAKAAAKRLNKRYFPENPVITPEILEPILEREERMDCFIHLLSTLSRSGADVPISSVHWVLGMNRQMALAEKIGDPIDSAVRNLIINHKAGLPLSTFNASYDGWDGPEKIGEEPPTESKPAEPSDFSLLGCTAPNELLTAWMTRDI
jgi:hypothetical protein